MKKYDFVIHSYTSICTDPNMFHYAIPTIFFNKVICYLVTPFYIVCSDKSQQHEPFERWHPPYRLYLGDWLHMLDGDPVSVFVIVIFKFNASAAFLF